MYALGENLALLVSVQKINMKTKPSKELGLFYFDFDTALMKVVQKEDTFFWATKTSNPVIPAKYQTKVSWKMPNVWRAILSAIRSFTP